MLFGRFLMMIPLLAAAGSLAQKKLVPVSAGTFPTHGPLFVGLLVGVVVIVGALTFFPALSLGPIVEHFLMHAGKALELIYGYDHGTASHVRRRHHVSDSQEGARARARCSIRPS